MPIPTICLTFDEHKEAATEAFGIMSSYGLVGTYFVTPSLIDAVSGPALSTLLAMKQSGWAIELYSGSNMVVMEDNNRITANAHLKSLKDAMWAKGLPVRSLAAAQRAWNLKNANMVDGLFENVRVADISSWQQLPVENRRWVKSGGAQSLSSSDTAIGLSSQVDDLIANGGAWFVIIHRVSDDGTQPAYTINKTVFSAFCAKIASEVSLGTLRCVTFADAVS